MNRPRWIAAERHFSVLTYPVNVLPSFLFSKFIVRSCGSRNEKFFFFALRNGIYVIMPNIPSERLLQRQNVVSTMCHCFHTPDRRKNEGGCGALSTLFPGETKAKRFNQNFERKKLTKIQSEYQL